jgi:hypothetical protein
MLGEQLFHHLRIGVADHHHGGAVGPVPAFVKGAQPLGIGACKSRVRADDVAVGDLQACVEERLERPGSGC